MTHSPAGQSADLDSTIAALQGGVSALPPEVALNTIQSWQQQLEGTEVSSLLSELRDALSGTGGGKSAEVLLSELGAQVTKAADAASGELAVQLEQLGQLLAQGSRSIS